MVIVEEECSQSYNWSGIFVLMGCLCRCKGDWALPSLIMSWCSVGNMSLLLDGLKDYTYFYLVVDIKMNGVHSS